MGNVPTVAPYGTWRSSLTPTAVVSRARVIDVGWGADGIYWLEWRDESQGRVQLYRETYDGRVKAATASRFDLQSPVYGYGGGTFQVLDRTVFFFDAVTGQIYRQDAEAPPQPLTAQEAAAAYADLALDPVHCRLVAVRERPDGSRALVGIPLSGGEPHVQSLTSHHDFYLSPRVSPNGRYLAFVAWNRPQVPWHSSTLYVAELSADGTLGTVTPIAGGPGEAVSQPVWSPDNRLAFLSDRSGWNNLYLWDAHGIVPLTALRSDFGPPPWRCGLSTFGFINPDEVLAAYWLDGSVKLVRVAVKTREMTHLPCPFVSVESLRVSPRQALMITEADRAARAVTVLDLDSHRYRIVHHEPAVALPEEALSLPLTITFPTHSTPPSGHGVYYPPKNPDYLAPEGELPPLIVVLRDVPLVPQYPVFRPLVQYWTSHGFAVLAPNVRGTHGYGRPFWASHQGTWGSEDATDVVRAVQFLARHQKADIDRVVLFAEGIGLGTASGLLRGSTLVRAAVLKAGSPPRFPDFLQGYVDWLRNAGPDPRMLENPQNIPVLVLPPETFSPDGEEGNLQAAEGLVDTVLRFWAHALNIRLAPRPASRV
ncbi:MAG: prolyl oligopeptidase family serine peptidase [Firmicutes bacterium]|nr:prolyl oligopeptidase family serine peptidase [Bacillota bacterium]